MRESLARTRQPLGPPNVRATFREVLNDTLPAARMQQKATQLDSMIPQAANSSPGGRAGGWPLLRRYLGGDDSAGFVERAGFSVDDSAANFSAAEFRQ